jgi:hypothetical protein
MKLGPKEIKAVNQYFVRPVKNKLKEIFMKKGLPQLKTPDEIQKPENTLRREMFEDANKRFNKAEGGRAEFKKGTNLTNLEKKQNLYNKALRELPEGYLKDYKNIFLKDRGDGTFSRKSGEEGGFDFMKEKYGNKLKQIKTRQGLTKNINEKIKVFNNAILQNLKKEDKIVSGLKDKDAKRTKYVRDAQGRDIKYKAPKGYQAHHMLPLGSRIGMTNRDIAIISKEMNAALSEYDKPMNKLVEDSMNLDFSKEGSLKKLDEINKKLAGYVKKAEKDLPKKYKGLIGFNKLTPVLDTFDEKGQQVFSVEKIGTDYKKSIGAKKIEKPLKDISTKELQKLAADAPRFSAKIPGITDLFEIAKTIPDDIKKAKYLKAGFKTLGVAAAPLVIYDTYKAFEQGKPILEALEQGFIGTDMVGGTKRILSLTPEERTARSVVKQDALKDLNLDMPMGFGFIEGPTPNTNMTLPQAQQKMDSGIQRVLDSETQKNLLRSQNRGFGNAMADEFLAGGGIAGLSGGDPKGAMLTSMNPDKDGLPGLLKRGKKQ